MRFALPKLVVLGATSLATACTLAPVGDGAGGGPDAGPHGGIAAPLGAVVGKWQAEDFTDSHCTDRSRACPVRRDKPGYTGTGYVTYRDRGGYIEWNNVTVDEPGEYRLMFRYANGRTSDRRTTLRVNGNDTATLAFRTTGSWTRWRNQSIRTSLRKGTNVIRLRADRSGGGPALDRMLVRVDDLCPGDPEKTQPGNCGCGNPETPGCDAEEPCTDCESACGPKYATPYDGHIILADDNKDAVLILEGAHRRNWNLATDTKWRWNVNEARDGSGRRLGSSFVSKFSKNKNDAKPVWYADEIHILVVTNAGDGIALVRLADKRVVFWKDLGSGGAHSAAMLPDGNIVIADSQKKKGDRKHGAAIVLSTKTGRTQHCWQTGAHGAVWDHERQRVWVWGGSKMASYAYDGDRDNPALSCSTAKVWSGVATGGGHDLTPMLDGSRRLAFTASNGINWFDTTQGSEDWGVIEPIGRGLKAVSHNPTTGEFIYVKAESDSRSDDVRSLSNQPRTLANGKWYKARWFLPNCFSWPAD